MENVAVFFCPPLSEYPEQPKDMSKCEAIDCPTCEQKMWFSEKKKTYKALCEQAGKEIILECYHCFSKRVKENPEEWKDHPRVDI